MANVYTVNITLTDVGYDSGPFDVYYSTDGGITYTQILFDIPASSFTGSGYYLMGVPNDANLIKVVSDGVCINEIVMDVIGWVSDPCVATTTTTTICYPWPISSAPMFDSILTSDNDIVVVGNDVNIGPDTMNLNTHAGSFIKFNPNATLDNLFLIPITAYTANSKIVIVSQFSNGKFLVYVDGTSTDANGTNFSGLTRLNIDGTFDLDYSQILDNEGSVFYYSGFYIQPDDKIIFFGRFIQYNAQLCRGLIRLNYDGTIDNTFNTSSNSMDFGVMGSIQNSDVPGVKKVGIQSDGKIVCVGYFTANTTSRNIIRINTDGTIDNTFNTGTGFEFLGTLGSLVFEFNNCLDVSIQSDGKIIISGLFDKYNGTTVKNIVRLNSDGTIDSTFNTNILALLNNEWSIYKFNIRPSGKIIFGISSNTDVLNNGKITVVRVNSDGSLDLTFNQFDLFGIPGYGGLVFSYTTHPNNKILLCGVFFDGTYDFMKLINEDGTPSLCA